jgi:biopolymer transport protein ExbD
MRLRKKSSKMLEGDLTPMIDMTFQLIAFFMVLVNFAESEQDARVVLPESELAKPPEKAPDDWLTIHVTKTKEAIIDGIPEPIDNLSPVLSRKGQFYESTGKVKGDVVLIIRAHQHAPTGDVQNVIKKCQEAGFEKFVLRAKEKMKY